MLLRFRDDLLEDSAVEPVLALWSFPDQEVPPAAAVYTK